MDTDIGEDFTLINIDTVRLVSGAGSREAHLTLASEGAGVVTTLPVRTECRVLGTLVNILNFNIIIVSVLLLVLYN